MDYYPIMLNVSECNVLIVGGGKVAARKLNGLLQSSVKKILIVAPTISDEIEDIVKQDERVDWKCATFEEADLQQVQLVFAATSQKELNAIITKSAQQSNILACNVSEHNESSFITPSVVREGDLVLSFSTSGKSPAWSKYMKSKLYEQFVTPYQAAISHMGRLRIDLERDNVEVNIRAVITEQALSEVLEISSDNYESWYQSLINRHVPKQSEGV